MTLSQRIDAYEKLIRLDKPIGILLLLWPTLWALWLSSHGHPDWRVVWIFFMGTVLMRSAGCAINDFADRDFDAHVDRTRDRPLAAGRIKPVEALLVAAVLALISFALVLQLNAQTIKLSVVALVIAVAYPFTKRFFSLPQAILGVAFGFGIPMAFAAQTTFVPLVAWVLLVANVFWAIAYDTEYAMVDRADDVKLGLRTSAITFGRFDVVAVIVSYVLFLSIMAYVGRFFHLAWPYYAGLAVAAVLVVFQYRMIRGRDRQACFRAFQHNNWIGAAIFAGTFAAYYLQQHV